MALGLCSTVGLPEAIVDLVCMEAGDEMKQ